MSGKGAGKKRNRAAQSLQHGYQEHPEDVAGKTDAGEPKGATKDGRTDRQRILDQLRELDERRREGEQ
jgi:hypothetical protein